MAKKVKTIVKLQIPAGQATPAPPVGPALGQHGLKIMEFCQAFNNQTKDKAGLIVPAVITVYEDKTFTFVVKSPPAAVLIKQACGLAKASGKPNKEKVGKITRAQLQEIAKQKIKDMNASGLPEAMKIVEGTCRSMGVEVVE